MTIVFAHDGVCVFEGTLTGLTAVKSFDTNLISTPKDATHFIRYSTGATAALIVGETLTGGTSAKTCVLVAQAVENGTAGSGDSGIIFVKSVSGDFQAETLTGSTSSGTVIIAKNLIPLEKRNPNPKAALIVVESAGVNCTSGGTLPTVAAGTNHGIYIGPGQSRVLRGIQNIKNFAVINSAASNGAILKYELYF